MALSAKSLFLYNFQVNSTNNSLDFRAVSLGPILQATITQGFYSLTSLMAEISVQMNAADPAHTYTVTADRTVSSGTQNRVTIATNGTYLDLLFGTGPRNTTTIAPLIGFTSTDKTGATTYTGTSTAGTALQTSEIGYSFLDPSFYREIFGSVNLSASGKKEAISFNIQKFLQVEFKYEAKTKVINEWQPFMSWAIQQRPFDFTPEITNPNTFYQVTLEKTDSNSKGLGYRMPEMLPQYPNYYRTGNLIFRQSS